METKPAKGRFKRLAAWKKAALILGGFVVVVFVAAFGLALFSTLGVRRTVENTLAGGRETESRYVSTVPTTLRTPDGRSVLHAAAPKAPGRTAQDAAAPAALAGLPGLETWDRQLILTASMALEVNDVRAAYDRIQMVAAAEGALVTSATLRAAEGDDGKPGYGRASVVLRLPQSRFHAVRQRLLDLAGDLEGRVLRDEVSSEDVTEEYVDLQSRLRNWRAQEAQLLEVMRQAKRIPDILEVRNKLFEVQQEIERLSGRLRFLQNRVDLATITVEIAQKGARPAQPSIAATSRDAGKAIAAAAVKSLRDVALVLGMVGAAIIYLAPFALVAALIWIAVRSARRRALPRAPGAS